MTEKRVRPPPQAADDPSASVAITGMMAEQTRHAAVMTTVQRDMGDLQCSMARIEQILQTHVDEQKSLVRIVRGENGDRSLMSRTLVLEQEQKTMTENWDRIEKHLVSIESNMEERAEDRNRQISQVWLAIIIAAVGLLGTCGASFVTLLRHP